MSWLFGYSSSSSGPAEPGAETPPSPAPKPSSSMASREKSLEGPAFASSKCPPGTGLEHSCDLPFGFVWTPLADIPKQVLKAGGGGTSATAESSSLESKAVPIPIIECPTSSLPPVLCLTCLAYLNPHCTVKYSTGVWTCALCGSENALPKRLLGADGLLNPVLSASMVEYHQPIPQPPPGSDDEKDVGGDVCTLILVVDANLDAADATGIVKAMEQVLPDLVATNEGDGADGTMTAPHPKVELGLVVFDRKVALYQLGVAGLASADIYGAAEDDDDKLREEALTNRPYLKSISSKADLESLSTCLSAIFGVSLEGSSSSSGMSSSRMEMLRERKLARERQQQLQQEGVITAQLPAESPWGQKPAFNKLSSSSSRKSQPRCTGDAVQCAMDLASVKERRTSRVLLFTNGCPNMGDGSTVAETDDEGMEAASSSKKESKSSSKKGKKHDVVDGGQMSKALEFYDALSSLAYEAGISVDVFCAGFMELALPAYQALVEPSGGYVLPHSTFDSPQLVHNLNYCLGHTYMSRTTNEIPVGKGAEVEPPKTGLARFFGRRKKVEEDDKGGQRAPECVIDIRTDSFLTPTHLVGPAELIDSTSFGKHGSTRLMRNEKAAFAEGCKLATKKEIQTKNLPSGEALDLSLTRLKLARVDPLTTLAVMVQVNDTMEPEEDLYAFFQTTARYIARDGKTMITRVSTRRMEVAKSVGEYVKHADDDVVSVLLAKSAVYRSLHGRDETDDTKDKVIAGDTETLEQLAYDAQLDLDATIQRISGAFRLLGLEENTKMLDLEEKKEAASPSSSLDFAFPPQLRGGLQRLYHLRRGALISPGPMQSMDDRAGVRQLFLRFPVEDCVGMMAPKLWSTGNLENVRSASGMGSMIPFPAETMALWDGSIIAADQHDVQFVWSGKVCAQSNPFDAVRARFKELLQARAQNRFPMPEIHMLVDGDSMSRRFTTRLAPSHADSPEQQLANFPELAGLSPTTLESLRSRFKFYDAASDASFRTWFWSVSSATNASREDGMSLCE